MDALHSSFSKYVESSTFQLFCLILSYTQFETFKIKKWSIFYIGMITDSL